MFLAGEHLVFTGGKTIWMNLRPFPSIALCILTVHPHCASRVISSRALENGGFFFMAGARHRGKSSFL